MKTLDLERKSRILVLFAAAALVLQSCYIVEFFDKKEKKKSTDDPTLGVVIGQPLGERAGSVNEVALSAVYSLTTEVAPAAIRPDPDVYIRRLLRQYRPEGATMARQIGAVEQFRLLLGGAEEDFSKMPQEGYDATSLLATYNVAETICRGLVAPNTWQHPGWSTILPYSATDYTNNIQFLAQRFIGKPSADIPDAIVDALYNILEVESAAMDANEVSWNPLVVYIPVCATLALDAESLFL